MLTVDRHGSLHIDDVRAGRRAARLRRRAGPVGRSAGCAVREYAGGVRMSAHRVGLVVPSSNTTMETEVPELLRRREAVAPERFTTHTRPGADAPGDAGGAGPDERGQRPVRGELADARCDVLAYACLVAVMAEGPGAHEAAEARLAAAARAAGHAMPVVTSAGALVAGLSALGRAAGGADRAVRAEPLTAKVVRLPGRLRRRGGRRGSASASPTTSRSAGSTPARLPELARGWTCADADAVVLSACVQMPSLPAVPVVEEELGLPVLTAATATVHQVLTRLGLSTRGCRRRARCWPESRSVDGRPAGAGQPVDQAQGVGQPSPGHGRHECGRPLQR